MTKLAKRNKKVKMIKKIFILTLLIAAISMSSASPVADGEEIPEYIEPTEPVEMNLTETELLGNESSLAGVYAQNYPSQFGYLTVTIKYASGLRDTDGWFNLPDPYTKVYAHSSQCSVGSTDSQSTHYIRGTTNPHWNTKMYFGWGSWVTFNFQVWDSDATWDDRMTGVHTVYVTPGVHCDRVYYDWGSVAYDYYLKTQSELCNGDVC